MYFVSFKTILLSLILLITFSTTTLAGFFVIPAVKKENNIITVQTTNGNFDNPIDAMNSITDSSEETPYLILMGPGIFNIGGNQLIMKPHVNILGSGREQTTITGSRSSDVANNNADGSLIIGAEGTSLKALTIINSTNINNDNSACISFMNSNASIEDANIRLYSTSSEIRAILAKNSTVALNNIEIIVDNGSSYAYGLVGETSIIDAQNLTIIVLPDGDKTTSGIRLVDDSELHSRVLSITISGTGSLDHYGVFISNSNAVISSASIEISNGSSHNYGIYLNSTSECNLSDSNMSAYDFESTAYRQSGTSSSIIDNCTLSGGQWAAYNSANDNIHHIDIINSEISGDTLNSNCIRCFDPDNNLLNSICDLP